jgi:hypothetical protein
MELKVMKRALHPQHSLDLTRSDFYLFVHVKQLLREYEFADREALPHVIEVIWGHRKVILEDAFLSWMRRLRQYGRAAGEYEEYTKFLSAENFSALVSS